MFSPPWGGWRRQSYTIIAQRIEFVADVAMEDTNSDTNRWLLNPNDYAGLETWM